MLPRLECAAFNTWVIPNFCKAALFWATALARQRDRKRFKARVNATHHSIMFRNHLVKGNNISCTFSQIIKHEVKHTYTFPMYIFGQTSSTSLRCSLHESRTFCRSFTVRYSFLLSFRADILSPNLPGLGSITAPNVCCINAVPVNSGPGWSVRAGVPSAVTGQLPNLVLNPAYSLTRTEGKATNSAAGAVLLTPHWASNLISLKQRWISP